MTSNGSHLPNPSDGRFDDIDDDDPMEGIEIPKKFLAKEVHTGESPESESVHKKEHFDDEFMERFETLSGVKNQDFKSRQNMSWLGGFGYFDRPSEQSTFESVKKDINKSTKKCPNNFFDFSSLFGRNKSKKCDPDKLKPEYTAKLNLYNNGSESTESSSKTLKGFACEKIPGTYGDPPEEKFKQPIKIKSLDVDRMCHYPGQFLERLKSGHGRYQRGYCEKLKPMDHDTPKPDGHTRFVCISDTHGEHRRIKLPQGDVLLHCGDFTFAGELKEIDEFNKWLGEVPFEHKIVIAGNHELSFDQGIMEGVKIAKRTNSYAPFGKYLKPIEEKDWRNIRSRLTNCTYLEDNGVTINGIKIWGSPWQPEFGKWGFNLPRGQSLMEKWNKIPDETDILMTHGPPAGHGDWVVSAQRVGCVDLLNTVQLRVQPKYHLFGHIHEGYGVTTDQFTTYINCSSVDYCYDPEHAPIVFDLPNCVAES